MVKRGSFLVGVFSSRYSERSEREDRVFDVAVFAEPVEQAFVVEESLQIDGVVVDDMPLGECPHAVGGFPQKALGGDGLDESEVDACFDVVPFRDAEAAGCGSVDDFDESHRGG